MVGVVGGPEALKNCASSNFSHSLYSACACADACACACVYHRTVLLLSLITVLYLLIMYSKCYSNCACGWTVLYRAVTVLQCTPSSIITRRCYSTALLYSVCSTVVINCSVIASRILAINNHLPASGRCRSGARLLYSTILYGVPPYLLHKPQPFFFLRPCQKSSSSSSSHLLPSISSVHAVCGCLACHTRSISASLHRAIFIAQASNKPASIHPFDYLYVNSGL